MVLALNYKQDLLLSTNKLQNIHNNRKTIVFRLNKIKITTVAFESQRFN